MSSNAVTAKLSREVDQITSNVRDLVKEQKTSHKRHEEYDRLQKTNVEKMTYMQANLDLIESNVSNLHKELRQQSDTIRQQSEAHSAVQKQVADSMALITQELKAMRLSQQQCQVPEKRSPSPKWLPRKETPKPYHR